MKFLYKRRIVSESRLESHLCPLFTEEVNRGPAGKENCQGPPYELVVNILEITRILGPPSALAHARPRT